MKYCIYLHPMKDTNIFSQLSDFWEDSKKKLNTNNCTQKPFHSNMIDIFETDKPNDIANSLIKIFSTHNIETENYNLIDIGTIKYVSYESVLLKNKIKILLNKYLFLRSSQINYFYFEICNGFEYKYNHIAKKIIDDNININIWEQDMFEIIMWQIDEKNNYSIFKIVK